MNPPSQIGSVHLSGGHAPSGDVGEFTFSGAVNGTSRVTNEACEIGGRTFRHFTLTAAGDINGRRYFFSSSIYPYRGSDSYNLRPMPQVPLDYLSTPNPLVKEAPGGYPGFLNFIPKSDPGNAYAVVTSTSATSAMAVDASEQSGWFDLQMTSANGMASTPAKLRVSGKFRCGQPFQSHLW